MHFRPEDGASRSNSDAAKFVAKLLGRVSKEFICLSRIEIYSRQNN